MNQGVREQCKMDFGERLCFSVLEEDVVYPYYKPTPPFQRLAISRRARQIVSKHHFWCDTFAKPVGACKPCGCSCTTTVNSTRTLVSAHIFSCEKNFDTDITHC